MYPVINAGGETSHDRIFVNKFEKGKNGDIVVADTKNLENWNHDLDGRYIVKWLVATGGDKLMIEKVDDTTYNLVVNNKIVKTKTCIGICSTYQDFLTYISLNENDSTRIQDGQILIKNNEIFLLGENWDNSYDCADCGPIDKSSLIGRVDIIVSENENLLFGTIKGLIKHIF